MTRREFRDLADPAAVREAVASLDLSGPAEDVPLVEARGRTLAEGIDAAVDVPGFDRAAMDGFALRAADTFGASEVDPATLDVVGAVRAGAEPDVTVEAGTAAQVATGAVLPPGADAVVPVERTVEREDRVEVTTAVAPGDDVMPRGADVAAGDRALGPETHLGPRHVGLLAAIGRETVPVRSRPRVAVVSTGDELVQPGEALRREAGEIYDVNAHSIAAAVEAAGGDAGRYAPPTDDELALRETLADAAAESDLLLTSGSTSAGAADLLHTVVEETGETLVHGVAVKPGRPTLVGRAFGTAYVGLPGYPVSALSVFRTFVAPALREASGTPEPERARVEATLARDVRYDGGRLRLLPVGLVETSEGADADGADADGGADGDLLAYAPGKGSGATTTLVETDGVVQMAPETSLLSAGDRVTVEQFDDAPIPALLGAGEPDPALWRLLDATAQSRFLPFAPADGRRWLEDGIPDVLVADPELVGGEAELGGGGQEAPGTRLASWEREFGLAVADGCGVDGLADLAACDARFANLDDDLALRAAFEERLDEAGVDDPGDAIDGYHRELPGIASAARSVADGRADVGLALRATAADLGLAFVSLGHQRLDVLANPDRTAKTSVERVSDVAGEEFGSVLDDLEGYSEFDG